MSEPLISVLIATNSAKYLKDALDSIFRQTYPNYEVILILNGDRAQFEKIISSEGYPSNLKVLSTDIPGLANCLNLGLIHSSGGLIARLDSDDTWSDEHLQNLYNYMSLDELDVASSSANLIDEHGVQIGEKIQSLTSKEVRKMLRYKNPVMHPGVMYKRNLIINSGGYRGFRYAQDWELWLRLSSDPTVKFGISRQQTLNYRINPDQSRGTYESYVDGVFYLCRHFDYRFSSLLGIVMRLVQLIYRAVK